MKLIKHLIPRSVNIVEVMRIYIFLLIAACQLKLISGTMSLLHFHSNLLIDTFSTSKLYQDGANNICGHVVSFGSSVPGCKVYLLTHPLA